MVNASSHNNISTTLPTRSSFKSWLVVITASLFFFFEFMQMNMFNTIAPYLLPAFHINATQLGNLAAMYSYGNIIFAIIAGMILDRFSTRLMILIALSLCIILTLGFAFSEYYWQAAICRLLTGISSTFCMLSCVRLASRWLPPRRVALAVGLVIAIAMTGGLVAQTPFTLLVHALTWRHAIMVNVVIGVVFLIIIYCVVRDYPSGGLEARLEEKAHLKHLGFKKAFWMSVASLQNWSAAIYASLMSFPIVILGASWGGLYLMHTHGLNQLDSSYVTSMIYIGMMIGSPFFGWLSDKIGLRKPLMYAGPILCLIVMLIIIFVSHLSLHEMIVAFFLLGFFAATQVISYPLVVESNPRSITNTAEGFACTLIMVAGLFNILFGYLIDLTWNGKMHGHSPFYTAHNFHIAILMFPAIFIISWFIPFLIRETRCAHRPLSHVK